MSTDGVVVPITLLLEKIIEGRKGQSILACRSTGVDNGFSSWQLVPEFLTRATTFHQKKKPLCEKEKRGEQEKRSWGRGGSSACGEHSRGRSTSLAVLAGTGGRAGVLLT